MTDTEMKYGCDMCEQQGWIRDAYGNHGACFQCMPDACKRCFDIGGVRKCFMCRCAEEKKEWTAMKCNLHLGLDECSMLLEKTGHRIGHSMSMPLPVSCAVSDIAIAVSTLVTEAMSPLKGRATLSKMTKAHNLLKIAVSMCHIGDSLSKHK